MKQTSIIKSSKKLKNNWDEISPEKICCLSRIWHYLCFKKCNHFIPYDGYSGFFFYFLNEEKAATNNYNFCPVIYLNQKSCVLSLKKYICWSSWYVKMVDSQILYRISRSFRVSQNLRKRGIFFFLLICVNYFFCDSKSFLYNKQYQI